MRKKGLAGTVAAAICVAGLVAAPGAGATTYDNDAPLIVPPGGAGDPYPSSITVSGTSGPITDVNVGLDGVSTTFPADLGIVLVSPTGRALVLWDCVGDGTDAVAVFTTFDDNAGGHLPNAGMLSSGTYKPTSHCTLGADNTVFGPPGPGESYAAPGPGQGRTATLASAFNGTSAIGTWNLFVLDQGLPDGASIPGGWSLDVHPDVTPLPPAVPAPPAKKKCKKKKKRKKRCKKKR